MHSLIDNQVQRAANIDEDGMLEFLRVITPGEGVLFAATPKLAGSDKSKRGWEHIACANYEELAKKCAEFSLRGMQSYYAMSSYKHASYYCDVKQYRRSRTQANVKLVRSNWIDIDYGKGKEYLTIEEALNAFDAWLEKANLPLPTFLVSSGNGLHIYWVFTTDISYEDWEPIARLFAKLQKQYALKSDNISGNAACVLRPIGTLNYKDPANPKPVKLIRQGDLQDFKKWGEMIQSAVTLGPLRYSSIANSNSSLINALLGSNFADYPPSDADLIAGACQFFKDMRDTLGANQSEPQWFSALGVLAKTSNGPEIAQKWSSGHSDYSPIATQQKLDQWRGIGPTTCERIRHESISCNGCKQTCKSPIQLGYRNELISPEDPGLTNEQKLAALFEMPAGDILAARYFAHLNEGKNIFVPHYGEWFQWNGNYWKRDDHRGMAVAKNTSDQFLKSTSELFKSDPDRFKPYINFACQLRNKGRLDNMLALASSEESISVDSSRLDNNVLLLGVPNGIVDLRLAKLLSPSPEHYTTKQAGCSFDENADCPGWLAFLDAVFQGDQSIIKFIQLALGYTLTGSNTEELIFILYGNGANGKSVFGNVVAHILGSYGISGDSSVLVNQKPDMGPSVEMARYTGARYVSFNETAAGNKLDARAVKVLAGREPIVARQLYQKAFEFIPQFTPWLRTNHKPIVTDTDDGIWRRLVLIPCNASFTGANNDPNIERRLLSEDAGILRWMVEGAKLWCSSGLKVPSIISNEVKSYRSDSDLFGQFLADKTKQKVGAKTDQSLVWLSFTSWCHCENIHQGTKASFTRRLAEAGYTAFKSNGKRYYQGLELA
jgi:P4 family phage/plasmid primase-like protien